MFAKDVINKLLIFKIYKWFIQLNINKTAQSKNGQKTQVDIFPMKTYTWPAGT